MKIAMIGFLAVLVPATTLGHHSRAEFSRDVSEIEGELLSVNWANPHPTFELRFTADSGAEETWEIQGFGSMYTLRRAGVTGDYFVSGDRVRIAGQVSTRRERVFLANNMLLESGIEVVLNGGAAPYWKEEHVGGQVHWAATEDDVVDAEAENVGLFRVWSQPHRSAGSETLEGAISLHLPFNEDALAARAAWNPLEDPDMQCMPKGMPAVMITPHPLTFSVDENNIRILAHEYDVERIIHISDAGDPAEQPTSTVGYSVGRWEGGTLVVETSRIDRDYFFFGYRLDGGSVEIVERFTLSDDQSRLDYSAEFTEPDTFVEAARIDRFWLALGEELEPYTCTVG